MNRRDFSTLAIAGMLLICVSGCSDNDLSRLEVGPDNQVATYKVIDGM